MLFVNLICYHVEFPLFCVHLYVHFPSLCKSVSSLPLLCVNLSVHIESDADVVLCENLLIIFFSHGFIAGLTMDLVRFALTLTRKLKFFGMRKKIEVGVGLRISDIEKGSQATTSVEHTPEVSQSKTKPSSFSCDLKKLILSSFFVKKDSSGEMKLEVDQDFKVQNLKVHVLVKSNLSRLIADVKSTVRFDKVRILAIVRVLYFRSVALPCLTLSY